MLIDAYLYDNGPQPGFIFLFDMKGVKLGHLTRSPLRYSDGYNMYNCSLLLAITLNLGILF